MSSFEAKNKIEMSKTATILMIIGWITIIGGVIAGIVLGQTETGYHSHKREFSLTLALVYWIAGGVSGTLFISFGKIIELLTIIANKDYVIVNDVSDKNKNEIKPDNDKVDDATQLLEANINLPKTSDDALKQFFEEAVKMNKYIDVQKYWKMLRLDSYDEYERYTKAIDNSVYIERMYGSNVNDVRNSVAAWSQGKFDLD